MWFFGKKKQKKKLLQSKKRNEKTLLRSRSEAYKSNKKLHKKASARLHKKAEGKKNLDRKIKYTVYKPSSINQDTIGSLEDIYKFIRRSLHKRNKPRWMEAFEGLFIMPEKMVSIYSGKVKISSFSKNTILKGVKLDRIALLKEIDRFKLLSQFIILAYVSFIKRQVTFKQAIKEMRSLGLIKKSVYYNLLFLEDMRVSLIKAWHINEVTYFAPRDVLKSQQASSKTTSGKTIILEEKLLVDHPNEIKNIFAQTYTSLLDVYVELQEPYILKLHDLIRYNELNYRNSKKFYFIS